MVLDSSSCEGRELRIPAKLIQREKDAITKPPEVIRTNVLMCAPPEDMHELLGSCTPQKAQF